MKKTKCVIAENSVERKSLWKAAKRERVEAQTLQGDKSPGDRQSNRFFSQMPLSKKTSRLIINCSFVGLKLTKKGGEEKLWKIKGNEWWRYTTNALFIIKRGFPNHLAIKTQVGNINLLFKNWRITDFKIFTIMDYLLILFKLKIVALFCRKKIQIIFESTDSFLFF